MSARTGAGPRISPFAIGAALLLLALAVVVMPTTVVCTIGMIPTLVALATDRDPNRSCALTVGPMNFCGVLPVLLDLWQGGHSMEAAFFLILSPVNWAYMLGAAGAGWFFYFAIPPLVAGVVQLRAETRLAAVNRDQAKLADRWGPEVASGDTVRVAAATID